MTTQVPTTSRIRDAEQTGEREEHRGRNVTDHSLPDSERQKCYSGDRHGRSAGLNGFATPREHQNRPLIRSYNSLRIQHPDQVPNFQRSRAVTGQVP